MERISVKIFTINNFAVVKMFQFCVPRLIVAWTCNVRRNNVCLFCDRHGQAKIYNCPNM